jgi:Domain of unknown function DUF11
VSLCRSIVRVGPLLAVTASSLALAASSYGATTFTVTNTADSPDANVADQLCVAVAGGCTLQSDNLAGSDDIQIPAGTYSLTNGALQPDTMMNIVGLGGARSTTLDLKGTASGFDIDGAGPVNISGLAITGGAGTNPPLVVDGPEVNLVGVYVHHNSPSATTMTGGGIHVDSGTLSVLRSVIADNTATGTSFAQGGGIYIVGGNTTIQATTVSRNRAVATGAGSNAGGGGIQLASGTLTLRHVTLTDNSAVGGSAGGNLYVDGPTSIADSIITGGSATSGPDCQRNGSAAFGLSGKNIVNPPGNPACPFSAANVVPPPAQLSALGDHGGLNGPTSVPNAGSPAVDVAGACPVGGIDQRGNPAAGVACDIGAAELGADLRVSIDVSSPAVAAGGQLTYVAKVVNAGLDDALSAGLVVNLPAGTAALLVAPSQGSCVGTACSLGTVAAGGSASVTVVVSAPGSGALQASAGASSAIPDPTPADTAAASAVTAVVPAAGGGGSTPPPPAKDITRPVVSAFGVKGTLKPGKAGRLRATLSEAARVTIAVQSLTPGRRVRGKCDPKGKSGARCTITKAVGSFTVTLPAGVRLFTLPAKIGKGTLKAARYRFTATAKDAAGNVSRPLATDVTVAGTTGKTKN